MTKTEIGLLIGGVVGCGLAALAVVKTKGTEKIKKAKFTEVDEEEIKETEED